MDEPRELWKPSLERLHIDDLLHKVRGAPRDVHAEDGFIAPLTNNLNEPALGSLSPQGYRRVA
jgi:hypothetical protein